MNRNSGKFFALLLMCVLSAPCEADPNQAADKGRFFSISYDQALADEAQDGRLLLLLATHDEKEPRFLVNNNLNTQLIFGRNVEDWQGGAALSIDQTVVGFPLQDLSQVPPGTYYAQALLNRYKDYRLSNGKVVSLPPDRGEGQQWNRKPGNFYSKPIKIEIDASGNGMFSLVLDQVVEEIAPPADTEFVKHVRMRSSLLSDFWGEDIYPSNNTTTVFSFDIRYWG